MKSFLRHISNCFSRESRGASRAEAFALQAHKDGHPELTLLLRALSMAKGVHAKRFGHLLRGKIGSTEENIKEALETEMSSREEYSEIVSEIKKSDPSGAIRKGFIQSRKTVEEYIDLLSNVMEGKAPPENTVYYVCRICGHIHLDSVPQNCPVCGAVPGRFEKVI
jgi:rubrerythrin